MQISNMMTSSGWLFKTVKYWLNDFSRNICWVIFKLGTINQSQKRNKMILVVLLPWQQFCFFTFLFKVQTEIPSFFLNQESSTPKNLLRSLLTEWKLRLHQDGPCPTFKSFRDMCFLAEKDWEPSRLPWQPQTNRRFHFVCCLICIFWAKFKEYQANISRGITESVFYHFKNHSGRSQHLTLAKFIFKYDLIVKGRSLCHWSFCINNMERKRHYKVMIVQIIMLHEL